MACFLLSFLVLTELVYHCGECLLILARQGMLKTSPCTGEVSQNLFSVFWHGRIHNGIHLLEAKEMISKNNVFCLFLRSVEKPHFVVAVFWYLETEIIPHDTDRSCGLYLNHFPFLIRILRHLHML